MLFFAHNLDANDCIADFLPDSNEFVVVVATLVAWLLDTNLLLSKICAKKSIAMTDENSRRLSAIIASDIVGYSTMLEHDETRTLAALRSFRTTLFEPIVADHSGCIVKNMGDGWLVEFNSAASAVICAAEIQEALVGHELIKLRIGIHVGDIVHEDDDIFGEGINVAARLEQLAEAGTVLISDVVHRFIDRKTKFEFKELGKHQLKNIAREQLIYGWAPRNEKNASLIVKTGKMIGKDADTAQTLFLEEFKISGSIEEATDVAEELIDELKIVLSHRVGLKVISELASGRTPDYVLGGRVRVSTDSIRLNIEIRDGESGTSIWVDRFAGTVEELEDLVTNTSRNISGFVRNLTGLISGATFKDIDDSNLSLGELLTKSSYHIQRYDRASLTTGQKSLEFALKQAPDHPMPMAMLASSFAISLWLGYPPPDEIESQRALHLADKAVDSDQNIDFVFFSRALVKILIYGDATGALSDCERALTINPYFHVPHFLTAINEIVNGNAVTGISQMHEFMKIGHTDSNFPMACTFLGLAHLRLGESEKALQFAKEGLDLKPFVPTCAAIYAAAASSYPDITNSEGFKNMVREVGLSASFFNHAKYLNAELSEMLFSRLSAAGLPE